jgi:peptidyl-prolyl cis-trans isomerase B (cyclophilin B)
MTTKAILSTRHGDITIEFLPEVAPNHVSNFVELAKSGFYDKTCFHRVIPDFMIQGGDPNSRDKDRRLHGTGGSGKNVKAEFSKTSHVRGIVVADSPHLNGQYSAFGKVTSGLEAVDAIVAEETDHRDNPLSPVEMTVKIVEEG